MIAGATIFLVDDDESIRITVSSLLRSAGWRVETFSSAQAFLDRGEIEEPHCLVLDVELPGLNGLELQARLAERHEKTPIVFITGHGDIPMSVQAMKAGASEFLTKPFSDEALLDGITRAIERNVVTRSEERENRSVRERFESLTPREREVMEHVTAGLLNKQIAGLLGTSEITIKVHRRQVMLKMKANSLPDLVRMAERLEMRRPAPG